MPEARRTRGSGGGGNALQQYPIAAAAKKAKKQRKPRKVPLLDPKLQRTSGFTCNPPNPPGPDRTLCTPQRAVPVHSHGRAMPPTRPERGDNTFSRWHAGTMCPEGAVQSDGTYPGNFAAGATPDGWVGSKENRERYRCLIQNVNGPTVLHATHPTRLGPTEHCEHHSELFLYTATVVLSLPPALHEMTLFSSHWHAATKWPEGAVQKRRHLPLCMPRRHLQGCRGVAALAPRP